MRAKLWLIVGVFFTIVLVNMSFISTDYVSDAMLLNIEALSSSEKENNHCIGYGTVVCGDKYRKIKITL